jgi:hypothetical protein
MQDQLIIPNLSSLEVYVRSGTPIPFLPLVFSLLISPPLLSSLSVFRFHEVMTVGTLMIRA